jgi:hypothetical protein
MHTSTPDIYVEDVAARPCKRRRLDLSERDFLEDQKATLPVEVGSAFARPTSCSADTYGEISEHSLVCFGMVGYSLHNTVASAHVPRY